MTIQSQRLFDLAGVTSGWSSPIHYNLTLSNHFGRIRTDSDDHLIQSFKRGLVDSAQMLKRGRVDSSSGLEEALEPIHGCFGGVCV
ncbi:hypothetical protein Clacol_003141 [Clathrus columnatus]|uniref:Uncharacterized protein n=1 Tax=Clathrus columnatus TaxID=1419009 RepID=A0AAV5A7E2_9AGAM|nr:hypothetical protein Clacol_003141 [Clathrus columnatus]